MKPEYISKLHVENVGPFDNLTIEFSPDVTVIAGANGTGKTSILRCITHCFTAENRNYSRYRVGARLYTYFTKDKKSSRCGGKIYNLTSDTRLHQRISQFYEKEEEEKGVTSFHYGQYPYNILAIGAHRYFDYEKITGMKAEDDTNKQIESYANNNPLYIEKPVLPHIKQWMINRYFIIEKPWGSDYKHNWDAVMEKIPTLSPPNQILKFERIEEDLNPIFSLDGKECYLEELSSGFKSVLSIVFSIINWIEGVNDGDRRKMDEATGTVLIDEIETHLHPVWQHMILKVITDMFPKLQFIITTHSPYVIASADKNQVIILPSMNSDKVIKPLENRFSGWRVEYILNDLMSAQEIIAPGIAEKLYSLNQSLKKRDKVAYDASIAALRSILNESDSIVLNYEMKGAEVFGGQ